MFIRIRCSFTFSRRTNEKTFLVITDPTRSKKKNQNRDYWIVYNWSTYKSLDVWILDIQYKAIFEIDSYICYLSID